jgi:hypothetical protein
VSITQPRVSTALLGLPANTEGQNKMVSESQISTYFVTTVTLNMIDKKVNANLK